MKSNFENELILGMKKNLVKNASALNFDNLEKAADYLNSAIDIFEEAGMTAKANEVLNILNKIANKVDMHTKGLTSEKMVKNLLHHGTEFNMADDSEDLLNLEFGGEELTAEEDPEISDFEDEKD